VNGCQLTLYWIPVASGTRLPFQRWSLALYEAVAALLARRPRGQLYHAALKITVDGVTRTLEMAPEGQGRGQAPLVSGPVGDPRAARFRIFRYGLHCLEAASLPDEQYAVAVLNLSGDCDTARRVLDLAPRVPGYTWGRRAPGTREMWTSDSVTSWLLTRAGLETASLRVPASGRAPGWQAGIEVAAGSH
jgi:hypothetical protein